MSPRKKNNDPATDDGMETPADDTAKNRIPDLTDAEALPESPEDSTDPLDPEPDAGGVPDAETVGYEPARVDKDEDGDAAPSDENPYMPEAPSPLVMDAARDDETLQDDEPESNDPYETPTAAASRKDGGGFLPALLGGIVAAVVGFGAAWFLGADSGQSDETRAALSRQGDQLSALDAQIANVAESVANPDTSALETQLGALTEQVQSRLDTISSKVDDVADSITSVETRLGSVDERLTEVEKRPLVESSETAKNAFAAYERELDGLRASLEDQKAESAEAAAALEKSAASARDEMSQVEQRATDMQSEAEATAQAAAKRAALSDLNGALDRGTPYQAALTTLSDEAEIPEPLQANAATGVASLSDLRSSFPDAARAALDASIRGTVSDDPMDRIGAFLKSQTGARSLAPREGDDPDAILSRAEAALRSGDLDTTLSEIDTLPQSGQDALAEWVNQARTRLAVTAAAGDLADTLQAN